MSDAPFPPNVYVTERLWSEEVGIAAADEPLELQDPSREPGYEFSNGIKFFTGLGPYANPAE